jgi:hypothetical protein
MVDVAYATVQRPFECKRLSSDDGTGNITCSQAPGWLTSRIIASFVPGYKGYSARDAIEITRIFYPEMLYYILFSNTQ